VGSRKVARVGNAFNAVRQSAEIDDKQSIARAIGRDVCVGIPTCVCCIPELVNLDVAPNGLLAVNEADFSRVFGVSDVEYGGTIFEANDRVFTIGIQIDESPYVRCIAHICTDISRANVGK